MKELEKIQTKQQKVQNEIRQLENRQNILLNRQSDAERNARRRRLIEYGAILESVFPAISAMTGEEVRAFLMTVSHLPGVPKLPQDKPESPGTE